MAIKVLHQISYPSYMTDPFLVVVAAKSTSDAASTQPFPPDPNSSKSTISTVEREIIEAGGNATAIAVDVRDISSIQNLFDQTIKVNPPDRKYDLMTDAT
jgi:hypothetical protein